MLEEQLWTEMYEPPGAIARLASWPLFDRDRMRIRKKYQGRGKGFPLDLLPDLHDMQRVNIHILWAFTQDPPTAIKCVERPEKSIEVEI